ncbi:MAG: ATPase [Phycisphaeraceae bacterium]|nr:ATPase [Phycisphaeraceae bacterium]
MYNEYYGFDEAPFNLTPDPRFLFLSPKHREALNHMMYGLRQRKGFMQLTGEVGAGKTTICRQMLRMLPSSFRTALVLNPCLTDVQLLSTIVSEFGLDPPQRDRITLLETLNEFLLEQVTAGNDAVLIIDEAQDLTMELLEQVRLLTNLETDQRKLLQIILIGQPELRDKLNDPRLRQLRQRISVRYHLKSLTRIEMDLYIRQRLRVAGGQQGQGPRFNPMALRRTYRYSKGIPRLVNAACDMSLLAGYVSKQSRVTSTLVRRAIRQLEGQT